MFKARQYWIVYSINRRGVHDNQGAITYDARLGLASNPLAFHLAGGFLTIFITYTHALGGQPIFTRLEDRLTIEVQV